MPLKLIVYSIMALSITAMVCCKKTEKEGPVINVTTPPADTSFWAGDSIIVKGNTSDTRELHEMVISAYNPVSSQIYFADSPYVHNLKSYELNYKVPNEWGNRYVGPVVIKIEVWDHDGHLVTEQRHVNIKMP